MSFAEPGKILVSRSYYEVVSRLSNDYARLFVYDGTRTDKHVREHAVYAMGASTPEPRHDFAANAMTAQASLSDSLPSKPIELPDVAQAQGIPRKAGRKWIAIAALTALVLVITNVLWLWRSKSPEETSATPPEKFVKQQIPPASMAEPQRAEPRKAKPHAGKTQAPKPSEEKVESGSSAHWLIEMRKELAVCRSRGAFARHICTEKVRWKYCAPSRWNKVDECHIDGNH